MFRYVGLGGKYRTQLNVKVLDSVSKYASDCVVALTVEFLCH